MSPAAARAGIAAHMLPHVEDAQLGDVVLAAHQLVAVRRLRALLATYGGALLADDVGLGKTYVALAVARGYGRVKVVAPAGLRSMWVAASDRAGIATQVTSYEALSRARSGSSGDATGASRHGAGETIIILDEAHHARTTGTRRYPRIAQLAAGAHLLLVTATPVHNRLSELRSLVALFSGSRAQAMSDAELSALVYRRRAGSVHVTMPRVVPPRWIEIGDDAACLEALLRLPPPVPPTGGGDGGALLTLGLVRQWASSRAALVAALRRSVARSRVLQDALAAGRMPTRAELRTWPMLDDSMQLAIPGLVASPLAGEADPQMLSASLSEHVDAATALLSMLRRLPDPDVRRAARIAALHQAHDGERMVCFTAYAETAAAYWRNLRSRRGVARLSASGGEIASGRVTRDAVLQRFAPEGQRVARPSPIEAITLLITTDMLAEGIDLRDATVVVHLDLPWSPARMQQRVGRVRRLGSHAGTISVHAMHPPAPAEAVLDLERRLRDKLAVAMRAVGGTADVLPHATLLSPAAEQANHGSNPSTTGRRFSDAELRSATIDRLAMWSQGGDAAPASDGAVLAAIIDAPARGWLAAVTIGQECLLIASLDDRVGADPAIISAACDVAEATDSASGSTTAGEGSDEDLVERAIAEARHQAGTRTAEHLLASGSWDAKASSTSSRARSVRARALARIHRALVAAAPHRAPRLSALAADARRVVNGRLSAGLEARLQELTHVDEGDDASWLAAVASLSPASPPTVPSHELRAILVFAPTAPSRATAMPS